MQFKSFAVLAAILAVTSAAAIPAPNTDLNVREPAELYGCASNTKRDIYGRCPKVVREAEPEPMPEPAELYGCASETKRDINGRCWKE